MSGSRSTRAGKRWDAASGRWRWTSSGAFAPAPVAPARRKSAPQKRPAASSDRAGKRWDAEAGRWRWIETGTYAPAPGKPAAASARKPKPTPKPKPKKRSRVKQAPEGDIVSIAVAVFGRRDDVGTLQSVLGDVVGAIAAETGGARVDADDWRSRLELGRRWSTGELAVALERVDWPSLDFQGTRVHLGAITAGGEFLPISYAFGDPTDLGVMAVAELAKDVARYRSRSQEGDDNRTLLDEDVGEAPARPHGFKVKGNGGKHGKKNRGSGRKRMGRTRR